MVTTTWNTSFEATPAGTDAVSGGDDRLRELKEAIRQNLHEGKFIYIDGAGSANAYTATLAPASDTLAEGNVVIFKSAAANTGASTLNVNGLGAKNILKNRDQTLASGDIEDNQVIMVVYDGTSYQMVSQLAHGEGGSVTAHLIPGTANTYTLGNATYEFADVFIGDNSHVQFGSDQDVLIGWNTTRTGLDISATEGAALALYLSADEGDDAGDEWKLNVADGGIITLGNDINSAGTFVTHLTITPNSTVASSTVAFAGNVTANAFAGPITGDLTGVLQTVAQPNVTSLGILNTLTIDNLIINGNTISANSGALNLTPAGGSTIILDGTINVDAGVVTGATSITSTAFVGDITGDVTGNADTATTLETARTIGGTSFNGSANIAVALASVGTAVTVADESSDTTCFPLFTTAATGDLPPKSGSNLTFNSSSGLLTATLLAGDLTGNVTGNASGTAATVTGAAQTAITSLGTLTALTTADLTSYRNDTAVDAQVLIEQDGTGDVTIKFLLTGGQDYWMGIDNSQSGDPFIITGINGATGHSGFDGTDERFRISNGEVSINHTKNDFDFHVASSGIGYFFTIDAGKDALYIGSDSNSADTDNPFLIDFDARNATADTNFSRFRVNGNSAGAVTIPSGTAAIVSTVHIQEPNITATGTVTASASLYIEGSADEATNDYALWVDAGESRFDGTVIIGAGAITTSDATALHVASSSAGTVDASAYFDELVVESSGNTGITILGGTSGESGIAFGDSGSSAIGQILYRHGTDDMLLRANGAINISLFAGETVINDFSAAIDFRVEGTSSDHLLFADSSNDSVSIGVNNVTPSVTANQPFAIFANDTTTQTLKFNNAGAARFNEEYTTAVKGDAAIVHLQQYGGLDSADNIQYYAQRRVYTVLDNSGAETGQVQWWVAKGAGALTDIFNVTGALGDVGINVDGIIRVDDDNGPAMLNEAPTTTNPTLLPDRSVEITEIGGNISGGILSMVVGGANSFSFGSAEMFATNAAGPIIKNLAATSTVPTLIPNRADTDTGIGWNGTNSFDLIAGATDVLRISTTQISLQSGIHLIQSGYHYMGEMSAPSGQSAAAVIFAVDNGGKTELKVIFPSGSAIQLAIEA